jgi:hypothetical protein
MRIEKDIKKAKKMSENGSYSGLIAEMKVA